MQLKFFLVEKLHKTYERKLPERNVFRGLGAELYANTHNRNSNDGNG